jgi:UDP-N-acetylmuramate--alanine ligase
MSALARICLDRGARVTGADNRENDQTRDLVRRGAAISIGSHPELVDGSQIVVFSSAVAEDHLERLRATDLEIPQVRRGTMLAHLAKDLLLWGVAGTHGKTTTSSMLAMAVRAAGLDPTILLGGDLPAIGGNARSGTDPVCVAETDESDGSFLELKPDLAIVTNVEDDHLEYYGSEGGLHNAFRDFLGAVEDPHKRIICADCANLYALARRSFGSEFVTYGISDWSDIRAAEIELGSGGSRCKVFRYGKKAGEIQIQVPGVHMLSNALAVFAACLTLGFPPEKAALGLSEYRGTRRRFEILGQWRGATFIDDYGHHPTEIQATLQALRQYTNKRCVVVFQPHRYSRTDQLFESFAASFGGVDVLILTSIYAAGEEPRPGITSQHLLARVQGVGEAVYAATLADVEAAVEEHVHEGDTVLFLGAGDVNKVAYHMLEKEG